jgi:hypothetical protein
MTGPSEILNDELVLRHIPGGTTWQAPGPRITSKNFALRADRNETGLSVSRSSLTSPAALLGRVGKPDLGSRVAEATVADIRALGLEIVPVPLPDDPGHAEIRSGASDLNDQAVRKQLAVLFQFIP